jgi:hypothetical protein
MRRARVFPLFRRFSGGKEKNRFDVSIERAPAAFSRLVLSGSARECQVGMPNPQSGVNFFLSCPTLGGETETPHETREKTKRARRIFRFCQLVPQARTIFRETSNYRAREWHLPRRANGAFRTAKRAARGFASLGGGSTREKVRISVASARTPRAPSRNRRVSEDARFFSFRAVPRFAATAIRRRARAAGATKAPRRGASRATLMHAR